MSTTVNASFNFRLASIPEALALLDKIRNLAPLEGFSCHAEYDGRYDSKAPPAVEQATQPDPADTKVAAGKSAKGKGNGKADPAPTSPTATAAAGDAQAKTASASDPSADSAAAGQQASTAVIDYATLQKAVSTLFGKDKEAAVAVAKGMGFDSFKVMPAEKWVEALAKVNDKIAELEVA
jgi:hypothetical protein